MSGIKAKSRSDTDPTPDTEVALATLLMSLANLLNKATELLQVLIEEEKT